MKIVLDTNVIFSALIKPDGNCARILTAADRYTLLLSPAILAETEMVLGRQRIRRKYKVTDGIVQDYLAALESLAVMIQPAHVENIITKDPPDNEVLACAVEGSADYLVSGNQHFLELVKYKHVRMLTPAEFLHVLTDQISQP
jgi:putative PIN family toxin of toxin-antitoxin system